MTVTHVIIISGDCVSESTTEDYGTHTVSVTHLNGFASSNLASKQEVTNYEKDSGEDLEQQLHSAYNYKGLGKNDLKNINKIAAKKVSKTKAFTNTKQQLHKKDGNSLASKKAAKLGKKFSKKSAQSKRTKHYNPQNKSHKHNKV